MMLRPRIPATPRDNRPSGLTNLMASARPGASRSMTSLVPSGVWSRGAKPVPPVVTTSPWKLADTRASSPATAATPSATTERSTTVNPAPVSASCRASPDRSSRVPATTPSETVTTFAS